MLPETIVFVKKFAVPKDGILNEKLVFPFKFDTAKSPFEIISIPIMMSKTSCFSIFNTRKLLKTKSSLNIKSIEYTSVDLDLQ